MMRIMSRITILGLAFLALGLFLTASTSAEAQAPHSGVSFDVHLDLGYYGNLGAGFRADIPVVADGIIDGVDDDLRLSLGAEMFWFYHRDGDGLGVFPIFALQWNFFLSSEWSVFPELGAALLFAPNRNRFFRTFLAPYLGLGARYHFGRRNALLLRVGWPGGLQIGITF